MSEPRAYQEGTANFYGFDFSVDASTLIPRPETEQLAERTIDLVGRFLTPQLTILDIGTGSGIIAVTLKKLLPEANVTATDISPAALGVAAQNAVANQVEVKFLESDLFESIEGKFDLIIANLPYVPAARWRTLESQVKDFEPKNAIVAGVDGLKLIRKFSDEVGRYINIPSVIALEIDDTHGPRVQKILEHALPNHRITIEPDLAHRTRFAFATPKPN